MVVDVANTEELEYIIRVVRNIPDVLSVTRPGTEAKPEKPNGKKS